ncbi:MAG: ATP synthase gamma chain [Candidatus Woesebacteria bacterium GW2011_GWA1_39_8]|jgi:F-type H+-transporting ATPase subunit gamma|uniref:ATP synthase gamma chain n=1 Tax=Candidatus Woesebacteria bacterium GW2011_GWA1_39_8 TaxID=1618552 RepID=A0A0G0PPM7_9BACT|nr:MAG: ATP synthase gamma chain [Candidatus Woesebacteria bacterium GW2011_GWA1_39_8]
MANPRLIRKRVNSIKNIGKITKALEMVSASKVQRAQDKAMSAKPYARTIYELIANLADDSEASEIALMRRPLKIANDLFILITTNRGLAGSLNTNLLHELSDRLSAKVANHSFVTIGKKGRAFAARHGKLEADYSDNKNLQGNVSALTRFIIDGFTEGKYDEVNVVYNNFVNALNQEPVIKKLLPITKEELESQEPGKVFELIEKSNGTEKVTDRTNVNYYYEPNAVTVLKDLLPYYLEILITESIYEADASEHSARMIAMKNASDNASELSDALSLEYNKSRQSLITTEISDITTAQAALSD